MACAALRFRYGIALLRAPGERRRLGHAARINALAITSAFHVAAFGVALYGWQVEGGQAARPAGLRVVTLPSPYDAPRHRPAPGRIAPRTRPAPKIVAAPAVPLAAVSPIAPVIAEPMADAAMPEGGRDDPLETTTQAYRQAITLSLEQARVGLAVARRIGQDGAGVIAFRVSRDGRLLAAAVERSTGDRALDRAALAIVRRAAPFPPIPAQLPDELAITLPVTFLLTVAAR